MRKNIKYDVNIDLANVEFTNVKVSGIDFRGTNIEIGGYNLKPQTVYNKDLSNCNFEGIKAFFFL